MVKKQGDGHALERSAEHVMIPTAAVRPFTPRLTLLLLACPGRGGPAIHRGPGKETSGHWFESRGVGEMGVRKTYLRVAPDAG
ncbi:hypothetical protein VUR80DRAFT_10386 [Thermomyces stellatus]